MPESPERDARRDEEAVAAVRGGDAERYRELVERHERRVYALAWSRLGDPALAEEVTQESFIRAYRRLWLLGDGAKFAGWISAIARRLAINFGLRHRRELDKRERWALEGLPGETEVSSCPSVEEPAGPLPTAEVLRQTLGELPSAYRECLVLFHLDGRSGAEAAEILGISESALRVRLYRARQVLRERLQAQLEGSLAKLRPGKPLLPAIMAGVLAASSAQAAASGGIGASILAGLAKIAPFKWAVGFLPALLALPVLLCSWLVHRSELKNHRDQTGFRAQILRRLSVGNFVWISAALVTVFVVMRFTDRAMAKEHLFLGIGVFNLLAWGSLYQQTVVNRSRYQVTFAATTALTTLGCFLVGTGVIPMVWFNAFLGGQLVLGALVNRQRPMRLDYNLFLRARQGMLPLRHELKCPPVTRPVTPVQKADFVAFGRFLGSHWLVDARRWTPEGMKLRLPPVNFRAWRRFGWVRSWDNQSTLLLTWEGRVMSTLSNPDHEALSTLGSQKSGSSTPEALERLVADALESAWESFRMDRTDLAKATLGQVCDSEVFVNPPALSGSRLWRARIVMVLLGFVVLVLGKRYLS